jgi:iron complex outermembrane receptor protein
MKKYLFFILFITAFNLAFGQDEEVIVTSSVTGTTLAEIDSPVFVIKGDEVNYSGTTSLGGNLNYLLGVNSSDFGPAVGQPVIRGMGGTRVRILSNGKLIRDVSGLGTDHLNDVDLNDITQIEVVRGPSSLLYSNGTMGGIINIVDQTIASKDFEGNDFNIGLERQSVNKGSSGSFSYKGNIDGTNLSYAVREVNFDSYDVPIGAIIHEDGPHEEGHLDNSDIYTFSNRLGTSWVRNWGYFGFSIGRIENSYGIAFHGEEEEDDGGDDDHEGERIQADVLSENITIEGAAKNLSGVEKLSYFFQFNDYSFTEGHVEMHHDEEEEEEEHEPTTFTNDSFEFGLKLDLGEQDRGNRQNFTVNFSQEDVAIVGEEAFMQPVDSKMLSLGYFICRELAVLDLDFGIRVDQVERDGSIVSGTPAVTALHDISDIDVSAALTMGWDLDNNLGLTLGISSVARAPSELELFMNGAHLAAARNESGDPTLESERSNNIDFSLDYENDGYFVNASLYTNAVDNYIYLLASGANGANNLPNTNYVQADANFHGYEVEFGKTISLNNAELLFSYGRDQVIGTFSDGGNVPRITPVKNVYRFAVEQNDVIYDIKVKDVQREDDLGFGETATEGFTMLDLDIRRSITIGDNEELVLSIFGRNLLDEKARSHTSFVKDEVPLAGRNFGIKVNFNF